MTDVVLRFDDYSAISNMDVERGILETVAKAKAKMVVSVIPFVAEIGWVPRGPIKLCPLPAEKVRLLKQFVPQTVEIALHGYCHQAIGQTSGMVEFGGCITREQQQARLRDGKAFLEDAFGVEVKTFVPPWNQYTAATISGMREVGLKVLSADATFGPWAPDMKYVPATCSIGRLGGALKLAEQDSGALICALLHEYDFKETGLPSSRIWIQEFEHALTSSVGRARWLLCSECGAEETIDHERARLNCGLRKALQTPLRHLLPSHIRDVYWSKDSRPGKLHAPAAAALLWRLKSRKSGQ
jgi:hypothetical protein